MYLLSVYRLHKIILTSILSYRLICCPVFVYGLHRELHDQIRFTVQLLFRPRISYKEVLIKTFFTRIFQIPHLRDCRQILGITTATRTRTDGCLEVHQ
jgi:hypothetical protein